MSVLNRLFPPEFGSRFDGRKAALWLLGLFVALKLVMSVNSILNTATVAAGADGLRLESYGSGGAAAVLMLFALGAMDQLILALLAVAALVRYRAMVPFAYLLLLLDQVGRRIIVFSYGIERADTAPGVSYIALGLTLLLLVGLTLSLAGRAEPHS